MQRSTSSFLFPDINVWIALTFARHKHYLSAKAWFTNLDEGKELCFCRHTQLGFLRLLTTPVVMGTSVLSQTGAWATYDDWLTNGHAGYVDEPPTVEATFRSLSQSAQSAAKDWADSYLSAFAKTSGMQLVTFDQALHQRTSGSLLLI